MLLLFALTGCQFIADMLSTDDVIDASCVGDETVVIGGNDICKQYETTGHVDCEVGYRIHLDGKQVCPDPNAH